MWDLVHLDRCSSVHSVRATGPIRNIYILVYPEAASDLVVAVEVVAAAEVVPPPVAVVPAVAHPVVLVAPMYQLIVVLVLSVAAPLPAAPGERGKTTNPIKVSPSIAGSVNQVKDTLQSLCSIGGCCCTTACCAW